MHTSGLKEGCSMGVLGQLKISAVQRFCLEQIRCMEWSEGLVSGLRQRRNTLFHFR